ncbi:MAG TPA: pyridoxal-dependent decarboxylase [Cyclobacteriaceae bacterium]|nr:pyridoxal-dependent decarboxylase [Cyclobacteriaceae bacterium]
MKDLKSQRTTPLDMSREEFRKVGYMLIDRISEFYETIGTKPVTTGETSTSLQKFLGTSPLPANGSSAETIMSNAVDLLFNHSLFNGHPRFLGYITSSPMPIGALADLLGAAVNPNVGANILSPMATEIEKQTIQWLSEFIGVPGYGGLLVSGGNMANFTGFLAARNAKASKTVKEQGMNNERLIVYCCKSTHAWIEKAAIFFGIGTKNIRWIEQDNFGKMRLDLLERTIVEDRKNGGAPFMIVGTAGDVSTGAVDDLKSIGVICKKYDLWFHVDGAYGMPAAVLPELKNVFEGIEEADSIALDPHKWLYCPLEAGCTLVRDTKTLVDAYSTHPVYYNFDQDKDQALNYYEYGFQNSRGFRALKVWAALQQVGRVGYTKMIREDIDLSKLFFRLADEHPELEAVTQHLSITTLRYVPSDFLSEVKDREAYLNSLNEKLLNRLQKNGEVFLSNAVVDGKYCLRGCIVNFRTTEKDIEAIIEIIVKEGAQLHREQTNKM